MMPPLDAFELLSRANKLLSHPEKPLAVVGGAALGGFGVAFLVQVIVRGWTRQEMPRWALMTLRVLVGVVSGWLVALWVFSGGGGGGGDGDGGGGGGGDKPVLVSKDKTDEQPRKVDDWTRDVNTLYVEVLGEETLRKIDPKWDPERRYRVRTESAPKLLTLAEVQDYIKKRLDEKPTLKAITIVWYNNSPSPETDWIAKLKEWAEVLKVPDSEQRIAVSTPRYREDAPLK
jgi:hypothetical protein